MRDSRSEQDVSRPTDFPFVAGRLCLDFANTGGEREGVAFEDLRMPRDLARWFAESELALSELEVSDADLQAAHELRDALWRAAQQCTAQKVLDQSDVTVINHAAAVPALAPRIGDATGGRSWAPPTTAQAALATIARDAVEFLTSDQARRIRECASPTCILLFVDTSRPGRRRWCSMDLCGNRVKTRQYRRRRGEKNPEAQRQPEDKASSRD